MWASFKPSITNAVVSTYRHSCLDFTNSIFPVYSSIIHSLVRAYNTHLLKNPYMTLPSTLQDLPVFVCHLFGLLSTNKETFRYAGRLIIHHSTPITSFCIFSVLEFFPMIQNFYKIRLSASCKLIVVIVKKPFEAMRKGFFILHIISLF